jgi:hypothetical protein
MNSLDEQVPKLVDGKEVPTWRDYIPAVLLLLGFWGVIAGTVAALTLL